ncbi:MAG TPA: hypothetical protein VNQ54_11210 [Methylomirabilota bacterium]|nr:hypothetical protein [Methylomirabilota bacterium]
MAKPKRAAKQTKKPTRNPAPKPTRPRTAAAPTPAEAPEPVSTLPAVRTVTPERGFAARVKPPAPSPPLPAGRRAIFVDVENSSRADHVSRVLDHLAIDRQDRRVDLIAVGNWRVIGADSARLLARRGAHLVHSAPSTGVKDWSDLRIAVSAGVWLGSARPGDLIEIISDDRAFDAVGDVAALLGVEYRRLSHRGLTGASSIVEPVEVEAPAPREGSGRRGRRGRRRGRGGGGGRPDHAPRAPMPPRPVTHHAPAPAAPAGDGAAHTAPLDELVDIVRELAQRSPNGSVLIDTLARSLKERGFSRPPNSPRLITRLRRIHELAVSRTGMITLVGVSGPPGDARRDEGPEPEVEDRGPRDVEAETDTGPEPGNEADQEPGASPPDGAPGRPRRRGRRRGRRRRGGGGGGGGTPPPPPA